MKAIRILAVLALVMFVVIELGDGVRGAMDGWSAAEENASLELRMPFTLKLEAESTSVLDSLYNRTDGRSLPYVMSEARVDYLHYPSWYKWSYLAIFPLALVALYGFYCVLRVIFSATRGEVFSRRNVRRMRLFVYSMLLSGLIMELQQWMLYECMTSQVSLEGYQVAGYSLQNPWFFYIVQALFTEIFAVGVKLKEEQELTI